MKEALKLALGGLKRAQTELRGITATQDISEAIAAIKETLAQDEQEPVAYCYVQKGTSVDILTFDDEPNDAVDGTIFPLYTAPPQQEPRNFCPRCGKRTPDLTTIHTCTPPRGLEMT